MKVNLSACTCNPIETIYKAFKLCYAKGEQSEIKIPDEEEMITFIKRFLNSNHTSPLEHVSLTFEISGVSRALTHQLVRHRTGKFNQQSQRYVKLDQFEYVIPPSISNNLRLRKFFIEDMKRQQAVYMDLTLNLIRDKIVAEYPNLVQNKVLFNIGNVLQLVTRFKKEQPSIYKKLEKKAIEDARYVFPNACTSNITVTMDLNNFRKFYGLRSCKNAQWEIRDLAEKMMEEVEKIIPFARIGAKNCGKTCNECNTPL